MVLPGPRCRFTGGHEVEILPSMAAPKLQFPCDYPIKVMVRAEPGIRSRIDAIVERHAGPLDLSTVTERPSAQQHFLGLIYVIRAASAAQIGGLFEALK